MERVAAPRCTVAAASAVLDEPRLDTLPPMTSLRAAARREFVLRIRVQLVERLPVARTTSLSPRRARRPHVAAVGQPVGTFSPSEPGHRPCSHR
jgi:hypothetical protein